MLPLVGKQPLLQLSSTVKTQKMHKRRERGRPFVWWPTGREHSFHAGVGGEHLPRKLLLLQPEVVLQVVRQHHVSSQLHRHDVTKHLQLGARADRNFHSSQISNSSPDPRLIERWISVQADARVPVSLIWPQAVWRQPTPLFQSTGVPSGSRCRWSICLCY